MSAGFVASALMDSGMSHGSFATSLQSTAPCMAPQTSSVDSGCPHQFRMNFQCRPTLGLLNKMSPPLRKILQSFLPGKAELDIRETTGSVSARPSEEIESVVHKASMNSCHNSGRFGCNQIFRKAPSSSVLSIPMFMLRPVAAEGRLAPGLLTQGHS